MILMWVMKRIFDCQKLFTKVTLPSGSSGGNFVKVQVLLPAPVGSADSQQSLSVLPNFVYIYSIKFPRAKIAFMDIFSSKTTKSASIL